MKNPLRNSAGQAEASPNSKPLSQVGTDETGDILIPDCISSRRDLSAGAKLLFGILNAYPHLEDEELARMLGGSVRQTKRFLRELEERPLIAPRGKRGGA